MVDPWRLITDPPSCDTAVLVYFANASWHRQDGTPADLGELRDHVERVAVGFYQRGIWCESGTGHDMFEDWRGEESMPTHWAPLLPRPLALSDGEARG